MGPHLCEFHPSGLNATGTTHKLKSLPPPYPPPLNPFSHSFDIVSSNEAKRHAVESHRKSHVSEQLQINHTDLAPRLFRGLGRGFHRVRRGWKALHTLVPPPRLRARGHGCARRGCRTRLNVRFPFGLRGLGGHRVYPVDPRLRVRLRGGMWTLLRLRHALGLCILSEVLPACIDCPLDS